IAFCRGVAVGINIERVVGTGLHAALTADTPLIVEVDDSVRASVEGVGGADRGARRIVTVVTSHHPEMAANVGELAFLDVLDPGAKPPHRNLMFLLARHRAGVTANTSVLIDNKPVAHRERFSIVLERADFDMQEGCLKCRSVARHPYSGVDSHG